MNVGFFEMSDTHILLAQKTLQDAKKYAEDKVLQYKNAHSATEKSNINKAMKMIDNAKSVQQLANAVSDFVLAHPSENLKVIK